MDLTEMTALIRAGVTEPEGNWADLGAGTGSFTLALRPLLSPNSTIYAIDRDTRAIDRLKEQIATIEPGATIVPLQADFMVSLELPQLDGILMANTLHFIRDQTATLTQVVNYLRPGGTLLVVEYDQRAPIRWVPSPLPFARFGPLAVDVGLVTPTLLGTRRSPSTGMVMYAASARRPR